MSESTTNSKRTNEFDVLSAVHAAEYNTLINTPHPKDLKPAHEFTLELDNDGYTLEKFTLYEKYQRIIHHESKLDITPDQFQRFLCLTPFRQKLYTDKITGEERKTGSFHQLYRVDGVLVAFAVLDLLPDTISSVYFIYDPDSMGKFGMGKVSALREVAMCIEGGYKYYGLGMFPNCLVVIVGLFAFGCEKLRYKAEIQPSELLDPVTTPPISNLIFSSDHIYGTPSKNTNLISTKEKDTLHSTHPDNLSSNLPWTQIESISCVSQKHLLTIRTSTPQRQTYSR